MPTKKKQLQLIANGDLRQSANQKCWPAQEAMEKALASAIEHEGFKVTRAHPFKKSESHGFIGSHWTHEDVKKVETSLKHLRLVAA